MKKLFLLLVLCFFVLVGINVSAFFEPLYIYTTFGTAVYVTTNAVPIQDDEVSQFYEEIKAEFPNAVNIAPATWDYNCHSYAWYSQDYNSNFYWMPDPTAYITDGSSYEVDTPQVGDRIVYFTSTNQIVHSGIVDSLNDGVSNGICGTANLVNVKSKWHFYGLYLHRGDECHYTTYNPNEWNPASYVKYYRLHSHEYNCTYTNNRTHTFTCVCGASRTGNHMITQSDYLDGDNKARCLGCNAILDLGRDQAIIRSVLNMNCDYFTLESGVIVLVNYSLNDYYSELGLI